MYLENNVLAIVGTRDGWYRIRDAIIPSQFSDPTQKILAVLEKYYKTFNHTEVQPDAFKMHFYSMQKRKIPTEEQVIYDVFIDKLCSKVDEGTEAVLVQKLHELTLYDRLIAITLKFDAGDEIDLYQELTSLGMDFDHELRANTDGMEVTESLEEILQDIESGTRFRWTTPALRAAMPDMQTGDQVIFGARPGIGKTSFIMFEVSRMVTHIPDKRPAMWLCNEGKGNKVRLTKYRTLTGLSVAEMQKIGGEKCRELVENAGCSESKFRIFNVHGKSVHDLEALIQDVNPCIIVWDMLDNVKGFTQETRTDLRLEELYKWARDCAVIYDFLSIPTSQTSELAEGDPYPAQNLLKDSKTGKAGACDAIIMMGKDNSPAKVDSRFFHLSKAWKGSPEPGADPSGRCELIFDGARCSFK